MATSQMNRIVEHLRHTVLARDGANLSDGQLLDCFIARHEESAFEILVRRHGPMVLSVCRRVVGNHHDAEDAFQATFLVLVRKAASIQPRELVGNWLYGVAYQTAVKAKTIAAKRGAREKQVTHMPEAEIVTQDVWHEMQPLLDQELSRLSDKYRVPIVLCDLEGKTRKEAAQHLGVPEGTISSRLARARTMLAKRLTRRGVTLSAGALAAVLTQQTAAANVPATLVSCTLQAAEVFAAGGIVSAKVELLTEGVLKAMLITKLKSATALLLILGIIVLSYVGAAGGSRDGNDANPAAKVEEKQQGADRKPKTDKDKLQGRWKVVSGEKYGEKLSADDLVPIVTEIVFAGDKLSIAAGDGKLRPFKIDPNKKPKEIDFYMGEGFVPAIYELDGNTLKICMPQADPSDPPGVNIFIGRPKLMSGTGPLRYVIQFERVPEAQKEPKASEVERKQFEGTWRLVSAQAGGEKASGREIEEVIRTKMKWLAANERRKLNWIPFFEPRMQLFISFDAEGKWKQTTEGDASFTFMNCEGTTAIDPAKKPKTIDLIVTRSNNLHGVKNEREEKGQFKRGIYEMVDDTLRICWAEPGKDRPADFSAKADSGQVVWLMERVRKAPVEDLLGSWTVASAKGKIGKAAWLADAEIMTFQGARKVRGVDMPSTILIECMSGRVFVLEYAVRETTKPPGINFIPLREGEGPILHGIYQIDGDTLKICLSTAGLGRPKDFHVTEEDNRVLLTLQRPPIIREIDLKGFKAEPSKNDFTKPIVITNANELFKAFPNQNVGFPDSEWREKIARQVDFKNEHLLYFTWSGSGGDKVLVRGGKTKQVVFRRQPGVTNDEKPHFHLYAISKDVSWSIETGVQAPGEKPNGNGAKPNEISLILSKASAEWSEGNVVFKCEALVENATGTDFTAAIAYPPFTSIRLEVTDKQGRKLTAEQPYISVSPRVRKFVLKNGESTSAKLEFYCPEFRKDMETVEVRLTGPLPGSGRRELSSGALQINVKPAAKDSPLPRQDKPKKADPDPSIIDMTVQWHGASVEEMERLVIELGLAQFPDVTSIRTRSQAGRSQLRVALNLP